MTLNQVIRRIQTLALAHSQVRTFRRGTVNADLLNDKQTRYAAVFLQDGQGNISTSANATTYNFRLFFLDLVHISEDTNSNELDVQSDMVGVAEDLIAQMNASSYDDWFLSKDNPVQLLSEEMEDYLAGCYIDISIRTIYRQEICAIPSDAGDLEPTDTDKKVYDLEYIANGTEGKSLVIPALAGKKVLLVIRENDPLHKVSNLPNSTEHTWNDTAIGLGLDTLAGARFLILYRAY